MEKSINIKKLHRLTSEARHALDESMCGYDFSVEIEGGVSECWKVEEPRLYLITRIEGSELVVCCAAGRGLLYVCWFGLKAAMQKGLKSIRFHTRKKGLARLVKRNFPFELVECRGEERVYRMIV